MRNNNPLNIRIGNTWLGERSNPTDRQFEEFVSIQYGLRAGFIILRRYIRRYHLDTVQSIISTWAPASDGNHVENYIKRVCALTGLESTQRISYESKDTMVSLVAAMVAVECGESINIKYIEEAYDMT